MSTVGWTFIVVQDCDFAGLPMTAGSTLHVHPGTDHPITHLQAFPPNYGALAGLLFDGLLELTDGPSLSLLPAPEPPSLQLLSGSHRRVSPRARPRWARVRLALVP
jgi:hypothetical protein